MPHNKNTAPHKAPIRALIWDCDGCLIDSEILACRVSASYISASGYEISPQDYIDRFTGHGLKQALKTIEQETGLSLLPTFPFDACRIERENLFRSDLKIIDGIEQTLADMRHLPMCIASGSELSRLHMSLEVTGLRERFADRIFSAEQVPNGKPAPDLFLYAAAQMKVPPEHCLVIEDSVFGIQAAKAAGMRVFAFTGASHVTPAWKARVTALQPDLIFNNMAALPELVAQLGGAAP